MWNSKVLILVGVISIAGLVLLAPPLNAAPNCDRNPNHSSCSGGGDGGSGGGDGGSSSQGNPVFVYSTVSSNSNIRVMDGDGSNDRQLSKTLGSGGGVFGPSPSWSGDGSEVAFSDRRFRKPSGLVVTPLEGNPYPAGDACAGETLCILFQNTEEIETGGVGGDPVDWATIPPSCVSGSADQNMIAFLAHGSIHSPSADDYDLFLISRDNPASSHSGLLNVTNQPGKWLSGVAFSPDGGSVATVVFSDDFGPAESGVIAVIDLCNGFARTEVILPDVPHIQGVDSLDWGSQPGQDFLLAVTGGSAWVVDFSSPEDPMLYDVIPETLKNDIFEAVSAVWSPDGFRIAVTYRLISGESGMSIIDVSSGFLNPTELSRLPANQPGRLDWKQPASP